MSLSLAIIGGCSQVEDLYVAPGKFSVYNCEQLAMVGQQSAARERELRSLMAKASQGSGGTIVNAVAYQNEYLAARGQLKQLEDVALQKNCATPWRAVSDHSMW